MLSLLLLLCTFPCEQPAPAPAPAQSPAANTAARQETDPPKVTESPWPELTPVFSDDFSNDSRKAWKTSGDVTRENGKLMLPEGSSIDHETDRFPWIRVTLAIHPLIQSENEDAVGQLVFETVEGPEFTVQVRRQKGDNGEVTVVSLLRPAAGSAGGTDELLREVIIRDDEQLSSVECRYGLVQCDFGQGRRLVFDLGEINTVISGIRIRTLLNLCELDHFSIEGFRPVERQLRSSETSAYEGAQKSLRHVKSLAAEGKYAEASALAKDCSAVIRDIRGNWDPEYAEVLNLEGFLHWKLEDVTLATEKFREAIEIKRRVFGEQHHSYATGINNLAAAFVNAEQYALAEPLLIQAKKLREDNPGMDPLDYAQVVNNLGYLYYAMDDYDRSLPLLEQALEIRKNTVGTKDILYAQSLINVGGLHEYSGDRQRAEPYFREAIEIYRLVLGEQHPEYNNAVYQLAGLLFDRGDYSSGYTLWKSLAGTVRRELDVESAVQSQRQQLLRQSASRANLDNLISAAIESGISPSEMMEAAWAWKGSVTERQHAYRQLAADSSLDGRFSELQRLSRQISDMVTNMPGPVDGKATKEEQEQHSEQKKDWGIRFRKLQDSFEEIEREIATRSQDFSALTSPLKVQEVQQLLPEDTAFVDFLEYTHRRPDLEGKGKPGFETLYLAFMVRRDREPAIVRLGAVDAIRSDIGAIRRSIGNVQATDDDKRAGALASRHLREILWQPLEQHLDGIATVIISPDTSLGLLPFAALPGRSEGQFLIEDYRLASLPLARMLRRLETPAGHEAAPTGLLIVGDIDYDGLPEAGPESLADDSETLEVALLEQSRGGFAGSWDSLPGFSGELQIVNRLFAAANGSRQTSVLLTRSSATEEAFLTAAPRCEYAHIVTHGYFADPNPAKNSSADEGTPPKPDPTNEDLTQLFSPAVLSGIVMAGANHPQVTGKEVRDGILRASEIESCSMSTTSLVVLSACETGLGTSAGGEGLTGLQRAFQLAGARSVVASLWKVNDRATQELMTQFYTNLWVKKQSKIDALRNAQLSLLRNPVLPDGTRLTRGEINTAKPVVPDPATARDATDPYFWAAWTLSGDWR